MADKVTSQEVNDGAGVAAYLLVNELMGLLEGMGIERETMNTLIARARAKAETAERTGKSKAGHMALQLLSSLERNRTTGNLPG